MSISYFPRTCRLSSDPFATANIFQRCVLSLFPRRPTPARPCRHFGGTPCKRLVTPFIVQCCKNMAPQPGLSYRLSNTVIFPSCVPPSLRRGIPQINANSFARDPWSSRAMLPLLAALPLSSLFLLLWRRTDSGSISDSRGIFRPAVPDSFISS